MLIDSRLTSSHAVATAAATDFDTELGNASGRGPRFLECVVLPLIALKGTTGVERDHLRWVPPAPVPALKRQVGRCFAIPRRGRAPAPHGRRAVFKTGFLAHLTRASLSFFVAPRYSHSSSQHLRRRCSPALSYGADGDVSWSSLISSLVCRLSREPLCVRIAVTPFSTLSLHITCCTFAVRMDLSLLHMFQSNICAFC